MRTETQVASIMNGTRTDLMEICKQWLNRLDNFMQIAADLGCDDESERFSDFHISTEIFLIRLRAGKEPTEDERNRIRMYLKEANKLAMMLNIA